MLLIHTGTRTYVRTYVRSTRVRTYCTRVRTRPLVSPLHLGTIWYVLEYGHTDSLACPNQFLSHSDIFEDKQLVCRVFAEFLMLFVYMCRVVDRVRWRFIMCFCNSANFGSQKRCIITDRESNCTMVRTNWYTCTNGTRVPWYGNTTWYVPFWYSSTTGTRVQPLASCGCTG